MLSPNYNSNDDSNYFATASSGNYKTNPKTGLFMPGQTKPSQEPGIGNQIQPLVRAIMTAYLRKQTPGRGQGYLPLTSAAPSNILQSVSGADPYKSYGVPYTGIQYGGASSSGVSNPYSAIFSPAPNSNDY